MTDLELINAVTRLDVAGKIKVPSDVRLVRMMRPFGGEYEVTESDMIWLRSLVERKGAKFV